MTQILSEFVSAIIQILAFGLIPFLFFLFRKEKSMPFYKYIGLYKPTWRSILYVICVSLLFVITGTGLIFSNDGIKQAVLSPK
jgi:hypothetical protein